MTLTPAIQQECIHIAIFQGSLLTFVVTCLEPVENLGVASLLRLGEMFMDMFYYLLICAVNHQSVCSGEEVGKGVEGRRGAGHFVWCAGGGRKEV